jgi:hypothetical protein
MKNLLRNLTEKEQDEIDNAFNEYLSLLLTTTEFIAKTRELLDKARTRQELLNAIDSKTIESLCKS